MTLTTERMAEIAKLAIRLQQISSCAAVTSSGETVLNHTHVDEILSALRDVTSELLATREAQPVALDVIARFKEWNTGFPVEKFKADYVIGWMLANYYAPPAPAVPDEMTGDGVLAMHDCGYIEGWNACRAAMLAQPVSGGYKLPDGWIACSERMPKDGDVVLVFQEGGIIFCAEVDDGEFYPDEFPRVPTQGREITHWMPLPTPPEVRRDDA